MYTSYSVTGNSKQNLYLWSQAAQAARPRIRVDSGQLLSRSNKSRIQETNRENVGKHTKVLGISMNLVPETSTLKWLFQLDDSKSLREKWFFHQTSIWKSLFWVPSSGIFYGSFRFKLGVLDDKNWGKLLLVGERKARMCARSEINKKPKMKKNFTKNMGTNGKNMKKHHTHTNPHQYSSDIHHQKLLQVLGSIQHILKKLRYFKGATVRTWKEIQHYFVENLWRWDSLVCWQATCCGTGRKTSCCNRRKRCQCRKRCIPTTTLGKLIHSYQFHISMLFPWFDLDTQTFCFQGIHGMNP